MELESKNQPPDFMSRASARIRNALILLIDSSDYAADLRRDLWGFAVSLRELHEVRLSDNDLRWLIARRYVEHRIEVTETGEDRDFRPAMGAVFSERACFVLTADGRAFAECVIGGGDPRPVPRGSVRISSSADGRLAGPDIPVWDSDRQELRWRGQVVKQFKVPSPNQETIFAAFEEEHWPPRIDDPLSPRADQDPKRRLHDTINSLNRNQKHRLIRFLGDGSGQGVRWEPMTDDVERNGRPKTQWRA
jgi:hypothetical protein